MSLKRVTLQLEPEIYKKIKTISFLENKSMSQVVREGMTEYLKDKNNLSEELNKVLRASDEDFEKAVSESIEDFSDVYKKLAQ